MPPIVVRPHLYERRWFLCMGALMLLSGGVVAGTLRLRFVSLQVSRMAEARATERVRIARDLHDTLLQGIQGLLLSLQAATDRVALGDPSRQSLERALTRAEKLVVEGRERLQSLRVLGSEEKSLEVKLADAVKELDAKAPIIVRSVYEGEHLLLRESVSSETFLIAREALANANRHADAKRITVTLFFRNNEFVMECVDDGTGMCHSGLHNDKASNGWGIRGMAERAESVGGVLELHEGPNGGLRVKLIVPSARAYLTFDT